LKRIDVKDKRTHQSACLLHLSLSAILEWRGIDWAPLRFLLRMIGRCLVEDQFHLLGMSLFAKQGHHVTAH
jgi:hypothetical protein